MSAIVSNMGKYFSSLIPAFKKKELEINVAFDFEELSQTVKPMFESAQGIKLSGEVLGITNVHFKRLLNDYRKDTFTTFLNTIKEIDNNQEAIEELIATEFHSDNLKVVLDYYKLNILKYIEGIHLFNEYSRRWLNAVVYESNTKLDISAPTLKADAKYCANLDNITAVSSAINMLNMPLSKFINDIKSLKGHAFNEADWDEGGNVTTNKLDPFKSNFIPVMWNPVYHLGLMVNAWRVNRYHRNQAEFERINIMLLALKEQKSSSSDSSVIDSLTKRINYYSNESNKLSAKIDSMEGKE